MVSAGDSDLLALYLKTHPDMRHMADGSCLIEPESGLLAYLLRGPALRQVMAACRHRAALAKAQLTSAEDPVEMLAVLLFGADASRLSYRGQVITETAASLAAHEVLPDLDSTAEPQMLVAGRDPRHDARLVWRLTFTIGVPGLFIEASYEGYGIVRWRLLAGDWEPLAGADSTDDRMTDAWPSLRSTLALAAALNRAFPAASWQHFPAGLTAETAVRIKEIIAAQDAQLPPGELEVIRAWQLAEAAESRRLATLDCDPDRRQWLLDEAAGLEQNAASAAA